MAVNGISALFRKTVRVPGSRRMSSAVSFAGGGPPGAEAALAPALDSPDPGNQFARVKGFGQIIVGPHFQTDDPVDLVTAGGQHQDRHRRRLADLPQQVNPVVTGEHDVEDQEGVVRRRGRRSAPVAPYGRPKR